MPKQKHVLISSPNFYENVVFLPYIFGILKLHCDENPTLKESLIWEKPIFFSQEPETILSSYDLSTIDVLGLSCYAWNWGLQLELAQRIKAANPKCLIIAGGPQPHWSDPAFFKKHPWIDIVVKYDGELVFEQIMLQSLSDAPNYHGIPGLILPTPAGAYHTTGELLRPKVWTDKSPFYDVPEMWDLANEARIYPLIGAAWETNRGCPYQCTFCDWGSATHSKIRKLPTQRVLRDLNFFAEAKVNHIFITDANFGLFDQDVTLASLLAEKKKTHGFPRSVYWAAAKNQANRVIEIAKTFNDAQFSLGYYVPIQTTNKEVLSEMGRLPKSVEVHKEVVRELTKLEIAMLPQIIVGAPGDTVDRFKEVLHELLEWGFHKDTCSFLYEILPNAPANSPEYRAKTSMVTVRRRSDRARVNPERRQKTYIGFAEYIVGHSTMSPNDWVESQLYLAFLKCFHHFGLTHLLSSYLHNEHGIKYDKFYGLLFAELQTEGSFLASEIATIRSTIGRFLSEPEAVLGIQNPARPQETFETESYLFLKIIAYANLWKDFRQSFLQRHFSHLKLSALNELEELQDLLSIDPTYDPDKGRSGRFSYQWISYFNKILKGVPTVPVPLATQVHVTAKAIGGRSITRLLNWGQHSTIDLAKYVDLLLEISGLRHVVRPVFDTDQEGVQEVVIDANAIAALAGAQ